jgi:hypothetical protein
MYTGLQISENNQIIPLTSLTWHLPGFDLPKICFIRHNIGNSCAILSWTWFFFKDENRLDLLKYMYSLVMVGEEGIRNGKTMWIPIWASHFEIHGRNWCITNILAKEMT